MVDKLSKHEGFEMFIDKGISHIQRQMTDVKWQSLSEESRLLVLSRLKQIQRRLERLDRKGIYKRAQHLTVNSSKTKSLGLSYIDLLVLGHRESLFYPVLGNDGVLYVSSSEVTDLSDAFFIIYKMMQVELTRESYERSLHRLRTKKYEALKSLKPDVVNAIEREREALKLRWLAQQETSNGNTSTTSTDELGGDSDANQYVDGSDRTLSGPELFD